MQLIHRLAHLAQRADGGTEWACPQCGRFLIRYPDTELVLAAGAPGPVHVLGSRYRDDPTEGPTLTQFDEPFLHRHAMAWSADHRPDWKEQPWKLHRRRVVAATAAVVALVATALVVVPAVATPPSPEVTTTPIGMGHFADIDTNVTTDIDPGTPTEFWRARIKTKRSSDLYVLQNTIPPGKTLAGTATPAPAW